MSLLKTRAGANFLPIIAFYLLYMLFSIISPTSEIHAILGTAINIVVVPFYLSIANIIISIEKLKISPIISIIMAFGGLCTSNMLGYIHWGIFSKLLFNPDEGTKMVIFIVFRTGIFVFIVTYCLAASYAWFKIRDIKKRKEEFIV